MAKRFRSEEMKTAYEKGGYRERYAMDNGNLTPTESLQIMYARRNRNTV